MPIKGNGHDNKSINITRKRPGSETRQDRTLWQSTQNLAIPQRERTDGERSILWGESLGSGSSWHSHTRSSYKPDISVVPCPISTVTCDTPHAASSKSALSPCLRDNNQRNERGEVPSVMKLLAGWVYIRRSIDAS